MTSISPRLREVLGYTDTNGDGVLDAPPSGSGSAPVDLSSYAKKSELKPKADKTYVDEELAKKAGKTYVDEAVANAATGGSADLSSYAKKSDLEPKADKKYVDAGLAKKADATAVEAKADKTYVDAAVAKAATGGSVDLSSYARKSDLEPKADKKYVDAELLKKADVATPVVTGISVQGGSLVLTYSTGATEKIVLPAGSAPGTTPGGSTEPLTVPLSLTVGHVDTWATGAAQLGRESVLPMKWGADVTRFKIHIQHINPRTGATGDDIPFTLKSVGKNAGGVLTGEKTLNIKGTAKGATDFATDWVDYTLTAGTEYGIKMSYTGSDKAKILILAGGSYITEKPTAIWAFNGVPFHIWIEAETPATTKIYTFAGDSLTAGVGSTLPVFDSWPYQISRTQGVLPVMYAATGSTFDEWVTGDNPYRLTVWDDKRFAKGDALFQSMGSNNIFVGNALDAMKTKAKAYTATMKGKVKSGAPVVTTAILPRNSKPATDATEQTRKQYNAWLATLPADIGAKKHIDFISAVSADDDNIPAEKTDDGTHLKTVAYGDIASSVGRQWSKSEVVPASFTG